MAQISLKSGSLLTLFLVGVSVVVEIPGAGRLMGPDILCFLGLLGILVKGEPFSCHGFRGLFLMLLIWFIGAMVTDIIRHTPAEDVVRGWSKIILSGVVLLYLGAVSRSRIEPVIAFLAGVYIGFIPKLFIYDVWGFRDEPWKFGFGPPVTFFALLIISTRKFYVSFGILGQVIALLALAAVNLVGNTRSIFGVVIGATALVVAAHLLDPSHKGRRLPVGTFLLLLGGGLIIYQAVSTGYSSLAEQGVLGDVAKQKFIDQDQLGLGLLVGGRVESIVSARAISDSPIIGHGSWARDPLYIGMLLEELKGRGATDLGDSDAELRDGLIPTHSHILGAWVEAGILGAAFWTYVLGLVALSLYASFHILPRWRPLVFFTILNLLWDIWFSPFGAERRFLVPADLLLLVWAIRDLEHWPRGVRKHLLSKVRR